MITRVENEIIELHQFFQDWYTNQLDSTEENFSRCADVLSPRFAIIFPNGDKLLYKPLLKSLREAHNTHTDFHIRIKNIQVLHHIGNLVLATYEEWQEIEGVITTRLSSVLFQEKLTTPNGLLWLHVHETWIKY